MARVKRYQQGQLASSRVGAPPLDTSGSMIASSILQSTAALSSSIIQGEGMRQQQAAHAAASAFTNVGQQLDHQRNLEYAETRRAQQHMQAAAEAAEKQKQTELTQSRVSNHYIPLSQQLNEMEGVIRQQAVGNNPAATGKTFGQTAPELVQKYIDSQPDLLNDPKAASDLMQLANHHIVQTQASLATFGAKQEIDDQRDQTLNNAVSIVKRSGMDAGPGMNPLSGEAIVKTMAALESVRPNFDKYVRNSAVELDKKKAEAFVNWAERNIEVGDPRIVAGLLKPGKDGRPLYGEFVSPDILDAGTVKNLNDKAQAKFVEADKQIMNGLKIETLNFKAAQQFLQSQDFSDPAVAAVNLPLAQDLQKKALALPTTIMSLSGERIPNTAREAAVDEASKTVGVINKAISDNAQRVKAEATQERMLSNQEKQIKQQEEKDAKEVAYKNYVAKQQSPEANYALGEVNRLFTALPTVKKLKAGATIEGAGSDKILVQIAEAQNALVAAAPYMKNNEGTISADYRTKVTQLQALAATVAEKAGTTMIKHTTLSPKNYADSFLTTLATGSNTALKAIVPHAAGMLDTHANNRYNELVKKYVDATGSEPPEGLLNDFRERVKAEQVKGIAHGTIPVKAINPNTIQVTPYKSVPASVTGKKARTPTGFNGLDKVPPPPNTPTLIPGAEYTEEQLLSQFGIRLRK